MNFEEKIGYEFKNKDLMILALTHSSYAHENGKKEYNEKLFLFFLLFFVIEI